MSGGESGAGGASGGGGAEEAARLFSQAKRALSRGALAEAAELADEAARLLPGQRQLAELQAAIAAARSGGAAPPPPTAPRAASSGAPRAQAAATDSPRARGPGGGESSARSTPHVPGGASDEQRALVARVLRAGDDPYTVLGVDRSASEEDAKRAYKKLALKLHPDKCKIPHAVEAFKSVSRAFSCLSDPDKRANYDRFGSEDGAAGLRRRHAQRSPYGGGDEMDADALFRAFFGGGGFGPGVHFSYGGPGGFRQHGGARRAPRQPPPPPDSLWGLFRQLQPLLLIFLFLLLPHLMPQPREPAVLQRSSDHPVAMRTARRDLPYYVATTPPFETAYPPESYARRRLESELEQTHAERLVRSCTDDTTRARYAAARRGQPLPQFAGAACAELHERYADMLQPNHRQSWGY